MSTTKNKAYVHGVRFGDATNSSSSHSIVVLKEKTKTSFPEDYKEEQSFGWQFFVLSEVHEKLAWLGQALAEQMSDVFKLYRGYDDNDQDPLGITNLPTDIAAKIVGVPLVVGGNVDHQSRLSFPVLKGTKIPEPRFLSALLEFLSDPEVVILGGNDNNESKELSSIPFEKEVAFPLSAFTDRRDSDKMILRYDTRDSYWSMYTKHDIYQLGRRVPAKLSSIVRFRIAKDAGPQIQRSEVPELVDINITNHCSAGCKYCYRGSVINNQHADVDNLSALFSSLADLGTFEVALGGGEPFEHPKIDKILAAASSRQLSVNVTTRRLDWLTDVKKAEERLSMITAIGYSVDTYEDVVKARKLINAYLSTKKASNFETLRVVFQVAVGIVPLEEILKMLTSTETKDESFLLLGHKTTGRGHRVPEVDVTDWAEPILSQCYPYGTSIDTVLAKKWEKTLAEKAWKGSYQTEEGRFSCFIDAVGKTMTMNESSFCREEEVTLGKVSNSETIKDAFKTIQSRRKNEDHLP